MYLIVAVEIASLSHASRVLYYRLDATIRFVDRQTDRYAKKPMAHLTFSNITVRVKDRNRKGDDGKPLMRDLLRDVSGEVRPGEVLAIMGLSGHGKTTLLNVLSGTSDADSFTGNVLMNGVAATKADREQTSYVEQFPSVIPFLSVREVLQYTARFFIPEEQRDKRITDVLNEFGLNKCASDGTLVGSDKKTDIGKQIQGLSGGERRRTCIANQTLTDPLLIILDEPISGLDSASAEMVMMHLSMLAKTKNRTVVLTIHQPSSEIYRLFDKLLLLSYGEVAYFGPAGRDAVRFFAEAGKPCPEMFNPADHFIKTLSDDNDAKAIVLHHRNRAFPIKPLRDIEEVGESMSVKQQQPLLLPPPEPVALHRHQKYRATLWEQFCISFDRSFLVSWRSLSPVSVGFSLFMAIVIGLFGMRRNLRNPTDQWVSVETAILFLGFIYGSGFMPTIDELVKFLQEKPIIIKEYNAGAYNLAVFFVARAIASLPSLLVAPITYLLVVYIFDFRLDGAWIFAHIGLMMLCATIAVALGTCYAAVSQKEQDAIGLQGVVSNIMLLSTGYYIATAQLPPWLRWLQWISHYRYGYEALIRLEFVGRTIRHIPDSGFLSARNLARIGNATQYGSEILFDQFKLKLSIAQNIGALIGFLCFYYVVAFLLLRFVVVARK